MVRSVSLGLSSTRRISTGLFPVAYKKYLRRSQKPNRFHSAYSSFSMKPVRLVNQSVDSVGLLEQPYAAKSAGRSGFNEVMIMGSFVGLCSVDFYEE